MKNVRKTGHLLTEQVNQNTLNIDKLSSSEIVELISEEDKKVVEAISKQKENISKAVDLIVDCLKNSGRIFFVGAGTSGRLGVLEAAECPPTFGTDSDQIRAIIAGGKEAVWRSIEGAEDSKEAAISDLEESGFNNLDLIVGIAASSSTPFVSSALQYAKELKACSIFVTCNKVKEELSDISIELLVGPEVIVGSTRLKAATATKQVLNMLTTAAMVRIGKTYGNLMVDVQPKSSKLRDRAIRIVMKICDVDSEMAYSVLDKTNWKVKETIIMIRKNLNFEEAKELLIENNGFLREVLD